ncbi:efflux RND transporter periplasmic adaptor subunit [Tropicimonas sp. IMCC34043]|uniref:efflux RND transporter periplasmic adaptor subunit n=1 Tax=Tropicimonas sp. IMCC34043 TaxID=2248760 RepID=UPI000E22F5F2|nr:efflux RND transporter periplasmic adaptor subunit [Tropicimonas sp. IMCC34043]
MKSTLRILFLLLLVGAGYGVWHLRSGLQTPPVPVTSAVARGDVTVTVLAAGMIEAQQLVSVGARVSGQIETLAVELGQQVAAGDVIARIDSQDQHNAVLQSEADLANIEAQIAAKKASLKKAELIEARQRKLVAQKYASSEDLEAAVADVEVYRAEGDALQAQKSKAEVTVETTRIALDRTKITAPIDGTVVAVLAKAGQTVNAVQNAPTIVKIANLDRMVVKAEISEADVVHVQPGQDVTFTILGEPETRFSAVVRDIEPAPSEIEDSDTISSDEAIYYNGLLDVDNPGHKLRIGMTTQVSIVLDRAENVLTVPAAALRKGPGGTTVEVWDPETATRRTQKVEIGLNDKVTAEVRSGLSEGDRVVTGTAIAAPATSGRPMRPPMGL